MIEYLNRLSDAELGVKKVIRNEHTPAPRDHELFTFHDKFLVSSNDVETIIYYQPKYVSIPGKMCGSYILLKEDLKGAEKVEVTSGGNIKILGEQRGLLKRCFVDLLYPAPSDRKRSMDDAFTAMKFLGWSMASATSPVLPFPINLSKTEIGLSTVYGNVSVNGEEGAIPSSYSSIHSLSFPGATRKISDVGLEKLDKAVLGRWFKNRNDDIVLEIPPHYRQKNIILARAIRGVVSCEFMPLWDNVPPQTRTRNEHVINISKLDYNRGVMDFYLPENAYKGIYKKSKRSYQKKR